MIVPMNMTARTRYARSKSFGPGSSASSTMLFMQGIIAHG